MPPFFIAPLFLILKDTERLGCLKWNSLKEEGEERKINTIFFGVFSFFFFCTQMISVGTLFFFFKYKELEIKARDPLHSVRDQRE